MLLQYLYLVRYPAWYDCIKSEVTFGHRQAMLGIRVTVYTVLSADALMGTVQAHTALCVCVGRGGVWANKIR